IGAYKLPWKLFREFMDKNYDAFHQDPTRFTNVDIGETDLSTIALPPLAPGTTDMAVNLAADALRDISEARLLAKCIKEATLSLSFDKKLVLAFDEDMARYQSQNPLRRVVEALNELKKKEVYRKILSNLIIVSSSADNLTGKLKEYIGDENSRVFVFAGADDRTRDKLRKIEAQVRTVYIDGKHFQSRAYYPIAEIVVLALARHFDGIIGDGDTATTLKIEGKDFELASINIESMRMDGQAIIFKLLPGAKEHDTQELIQRYAAMTPFLEAA
ncbi:MAG: hypothetical protein Q8O01_01920, partial [Candidatus Omnitrophota bacterium]|nr:hypothetical protein [Candidatus Omnitrophota bacterium]